VFVADLSHFDFSVAAPQCILAQFNAANCTQSAAALQESRAMQLVQCQQIAADFLVSTTVLGEDFC